MKNIILIAPPAAGKGTLSKKLSDNFGYVPLSTGDILREKAQTDEVLREAMKTGKLINDETVFAALEEKLDKLGDKPYILDGFPRTVNQAIMYDELLEKMNKDLGVVIYLDVDKEILKERITTRLVCPTCKKPYSTRKGDLYPMDGKTCDNCHVDLIQRADDTEEVFEERFKEYLEKTEPLIDYYKNKGILESVNSENAAKTYEDVIPIIK